MIIKSLYESLILSLNEARVQRTIDKKLWLSIASTCSRNKATEAENIKPFSTLTKEVLLPRYVAALLIMKKPCPNSVEDIEDIKTFKHIGNRLIELGCTFKEIQDLYVANGGTVSVENTTPALETSKLNKELKAPVTQQVDTSNEIKSRLKDNDPDSGIMLLVNTINSYDKIYDYVSHKYTDIKDICADTYDILEKTFYVLRKTFYKINRGDLTIYFKQVDDDPNAKIYKNDSHNINIGFVIVTKSEVKEGMFAVTTNDMTINGESLSNSIRIADDLFITYDEFEDLMICILSKLLYAKQQSYGNVMLNRKRKKIPDSYGKFGNKPIDFNSPVDETVLQRIKKALFTIYKGDTYNISNEIEHLLKDVKLGNEDDGTSLILKDNLYTIKCKQPGFKIGIYGISPSKRGAAYQQYCFRVRMYRKLSVEHDIYYGLWLFRHAEGEMNILNYMGQQQQRVSLWDFEYDEKIIVDLYLTTLAIILYYNNNYHKLLAKTGYDR